MAFTIADFENLSTEQLKIFNLAHLKSRIKWAVIYFNNANDSKTEAEISLGEDIVTEMKQRIATLPFIKGAKLGKIVTKYYKARSKFISSHMMYVPQQYVGMYMISKNIKKRFLVTTGLSTCVGCSLYIKTNKKGMVVHFDGGTVNTLHLMSVFKAKKDNKKDDEKRKLYVKLNNNGDIAYTAWNGEKYVHHTIETEILKKRKIRIKNNTMESFKRYAEEIFAITSYNGHTCLEDVDNMQRYIRNFLEKLGVTDKISVEIVTSNKLNNTYSTN